jgi:hypothetical protein
MAFLATWMVGLVNEGALQSDRSHGISRYGVWISTMQHNWFTILYL